MRHRNTGRKFGRTWDHRKAMFRNMARSMVENGSIRTTEAKAKELRKVADKLITLAVRNDLHARRMAFKVLGDHVLVKRLFDEIGPRFVGISGGYTRVVKLSMPRLGDAAPMALIEFSRREGETADAKEKPKAKGKKTKKAETKAAAPKKTKKAEPKAAPAAEEAPAPVEAKEEAPEPEAAAEAAAPEAGGEESTDQEASSPEEPSGEKKD